MAEERYFRRGFGLRAEVHRVVEQEFDSRVVRAMVEGGYRLVAGDLTFRLAEEFGFCYGVDRAVDYAYETRRVHPGRRIVLMGQIIHNPTVNKRLEEMGIPIVEDPVAEIEDLGEEDVVIIPAFGVSAVHFARLRAAGPILVDTTCGSVLAVWKNVERYARQGFTALIHGKYLHEETEATASRALLHPEGRYLVLLDVEEAGIVCDYIRVRGERESFLSRFEGAVSEGFDPDRDLVRVGMANQTTMLASETLEIQGMVREAMAERYGAESLDEHLVAFDTICPATQQRQDALLRLLEEPLDLALIVGGYDSSNTGHLVKIAAKAVPTYHIENAGEILGPEEIRHRATDGEMRVTRDWLPPGPLRIGLTAGASTPNIQVGMVVRRLLECRGIETGVLDGPRGGEAATSTAGPASPRRPS